MSSAVLGRRAVLNRPRRDAPTTTWVPFTDLANSRTAVGDVLADDRVEGAAEVLGQLPEPRDVVRAGTHGAVATHDVHGHERTARAASGDERIRGGAASRPRARR